MSLLTPSYCKSSIGASALSGEVQLKLFSIAVYKNIKKGDTILAEGEVCRSIFFLENGYLRSYVVNDGSEINTGFTFENNFITNLKSLRLNTPSEITIKAEENATVYEFNKEQLFALYKESPEVESCGRMLAEHLLIEQEEHANLYKIQSPEQRYRYIEKHQPQILRRVSLTHLASYIGVARETLSRFRKPRPAAIL